MNEPVGTNGPSEGTFLTIPSPPLSDGSRDIEYASFNGIDDTLETASVGADGSICFYGKTSLYHIDSKDHDASNSIIAGHEPRPAEQSLNIASTSETLSFRCYDIAALLAEIPPALLGDLLDTYWCYPHHLHCVLCKPLFLRQSHTPLTNKSVKLIKLIGDLYSSEPRVTPFLLCAVLAQAARYSTRQDSTEVGNHFAGKARQLMLDDIDRGGSSIPTLQGLLVLSARECACGRVSQGWLYSGMAFRMMHDLGLDVSPTKLTKGSLFTEEDLALRRQVFWSCYTWDKTMSLCLGRTAAVPYTVELPTREILPRGREADDEIWQPTAQANLVFKGAMVEQKSLSSTCFTAYCELCVITEGVLGELYSRPHSGRHHQLTKYLDSTLLKLRSWSERLPSELFIHEATMRALVCPPLHILVLNLMYHAVTILLCRPYRTIQRVAKEQCRNAAQMIDALFVLHVKRFGFRFITYLQTYTMFVASTINVLDFAENKSPAGGGSSGGNSVEEKEGEESALAQEAKSRLYFGLEVLREANSTPCATRCAAVIAQLIQKQQKISQQGTGQGGAAEAGTCSPIVGSKEVAAKTDAQSQQPSQEPRAPELSFSTMPQPPPDVTRSQSGLTAASSMTPISVEEMQDTESNFIPPSSIIEQPLKWLPENTADDGSWMLMPDVNLDGGFDHTLLDELF